MGKWLEGLCSNSDEDDDCIVRMERSRCGFFYCGYFLLGVVASW